MGHETPKGEQLTVFKHALFELGRIVTFQGFMPAHADPSLSEHRPVSGPVQPENDASYGIVLGIHLGGEPDAGFYS